MGLVARLVGCVARLFLSVGSGGVGSGPVGSGLVCSGRRGRACLVLGTPVSLTCSSSSPVRARLVWDGGGVGATTWVWRVVAGMSGRVWLRCLPYPMERVGSGSDLHRIGEADLLQLDVHGSRPVVAHQRVRVGDDVEPGVLLLDFWRDVDASLVELIQEHAL